MNTECCTDNIYALENYRWLFGEVIDHVGINGSKAAESLSAFNVRLVLWFLLLPVWLLTILFIFLLIVVCYGPYGFIFAGYLWVLFPFFFFHICATVHGACFFFVCLFGGFFVFFSRLPGRSGMVCRAFVVGLMPPGKCGRLHCCRVFRLSSFGRFGRLHLRGNGGRLPFARIDSLHCSRLFRLRFGRGVRGLAYEVEILLRRKQRYIYSILSISWLQMMTCRQYTGSQVDSNPDIDLFCVKHSGLDTNRIKLHRVR